MHSSFNFKYDLISAGDLVKGLSTSQDKAAADEAIRKADAYLQDSAHSGSKSGLTRTVINTPTTAQQSAPTSQQGYYMINSANDDIDHVHYLI